MSEYEIFNDDETPVVEEKTKKLPAKADKKVKAEKQTTNDTIVNFFKEIFSMHFLPTTLSIFAIFFGLFSQFLPRVATLTETVATLQAGCAFFFMGFTCAFAGLIIATINMIKNKKVEFNVGLLLTIVAFLILCTSPIF